MEKLKYSVLKEIYESCVGITKETGGVNTTLEGDHLSGAILTVGYLLYNVLV